jgi:cobalamin biosynthesis Mg chelatase CobN
VSKHLAAPHTSLYHQYLTISINQSLTQVQQLAPDNPSLAIELNRLKVARAAYQAREKQMAKNMASKLFPDLKKAGKGARKNQSESDRKEAVEASTPSPDLKVTNDLSIGKGRVEVEADSGSVIVQETDSSSAALARVSAPSQGQGQGQGQGQEGSSRGIKSNGDGDKDGEGSSRKGASSGAEGKVAGEAAELSAATPSALLMIVCSTAVLVLSLLIALYLK